MLFYVHRQIDGEICGTGFFHRIPKEPEFIHPFNTPSFDLNPETHETIAVDAIPLAVMTHILGMDSQRDCFVKCFTISKESVQIPELQHRNVTGLKQRFLLLKPEYKKYQKEVFGVPWKQKVR